jgi:hypothetical protein
MPAVSCHLVKINLLHAKNLKLVKISSLLPPVRRRPVLVLLVDLVWLFILAHCCTPVSLICKGCINYVPIISCFVLIDFIYLFVYLFIVLAFVCYLVNLWCPVGWNPCPFYIFTKKNIILIISLAYYIINFCAILFVCLLSLHYPRDFHFYPIWGNLLLFPDPWLSGNAFGKCSVPIPAGWVIIGYPDCGFFVASVTPGERRGSNSIRPRSRPSNSSFTVIHPTMCQSQSNDTARHNSQHTQLR